MKKISITTTSFGKVSSEVLDPLKERGFEIIFNTLGRKLEAEEVKDIAKDSIAIIAGTEKMSEDVLSSLKMLKVVSRCGAGLDNVDLETAKKLGIKVFNTPDAPTLAVAELTVGLILDLLRKITVMDREMRIGQWQKRMGNLLSEKKVGIVGFGRIGQKVGELLRAFNCRINYYDINKTIPLSWAEYVELDELLKTCDIVSVHVSSKDQLLGKRAIQMMKKGAWLINVSRGGVVDEDALYNALKDGYLSGAALDVFEQEPYIGELRRLDNVILIPHIGSYAKEARIEMERQAVENLLKGLEVSK
jgi:D-3-phosphoglycerate dehydrogenase